MTAPNIPDMAFDFNPNDVTTTLPVYDKGSYEIEVGEGKSFYRTGKVGEDNKQKEDNHGVFYKCKIANGAQQGKPFLVNCYMHTPESQAFSKAFLMAALGFNPKNEESEKKFNAFTENLNWRYNPKDKSVGEVWKKVETQHLIVDLDVKMAVNKNTQELEKQQVLVGYRPLSSASSK